MHIVSGTSCARREFLRKAVVSMGITFGALANPHCSALAAALENFNGEEKFRQIMTKAIAGKWNTLPIGDLMGNIAKEFEGIRYEAGTLDHSLDVENCSVNLTGLDCVTFFETTLGFARMLKKGGRTPADLVNEIKFTRYRGGKLGDYSSRLHYTTDWFVDNEQKGVVKLLSNLPGAEAFVQKVGIMSSHPEHYGQLSAHRELLPKIKGYEDAINNRQLKYVPLVHLAAAEPQLRTGDIVGVCTSQEGIDIAHTGLIMRDTEGVVHFMDASSAKRNMKVTIEPGPISETLNWSKSLSGAMFARPLEP